MGRFALMLLLLASSVVVSAQSLQDVRIVTADDPPYVQTENGRLSGGLVVTSLYRIIGKLSCKARVLPGWSWHRMARKTSTSSSMGAAT